MTASNAPLRTGMRFVGTFAAYLLALAVTATAAFFAVWFLAGPHGGVLPSELHGATLLLGWLLVLFIPVLAARWTWRRLDPSRR